MDKVKLDKTTITVLSVMAVVAVLLVLFMVHIVDRSSEQISEIKKTKVVEPTRLAPSIVGDDDLVSFTVKDNGNGSACTVSDGKLTESILHKILQIKNLHELFLKRCEFKADDFRTLLTCPLRAIRIEDGTLDEDCLQVISKMPNLRIFELTACDVPPHALAHLSSCHLAKFMLRYSQSLKNNGEFTAVDLSFLNDLKELQFIDVERTKFSAGAFHSLTNCPAMAVKAERCNIGDEDVADIANMPKIAYVNLLRNPKVSCKGLKDLLHSRSFERCAFDGDISGCGFTSAEKNRLDPKQFVIPEAAWREKK